MPGRKKGLVRVLVILAIVAVTGSGLPDSAKHVSALAQIGDDQQEWAVGPRVVWQYHGEPLTVGSLLSGFMSMRSGLIVPAGDTVYFSADRLIALEPKAGKIRWSVRPARMAPLCVAGQYVLTSMRDKTLNALSSADGSVLWSAEIPAGDSCWLRTNGTTVLACLQMGQENQVCAFDLRTGKPLWQSAKSSVTPQSGDDGIIYLTDPRAKTVTALDGRTGKTIWAFESPKRLYGISLGGSFLLTESLNALHVLDCRTGRLKWKRAISGNSFVYPNEGKLIMILERGVLTVLDPRNGRQLWEHALPAQASQTAVISGKVYATTRDGVWALDDSSGMVLWKWQGASTMWPVQVENEVVYFLGGGLCALDANSGGLFWKFNPGPQLTRLVISNGLAYISDQDGSSLYVIRAGKD